MHRVSKKVPPLKAMILAYTARLR